MSPPILVSHVLCPYVQRAIIVGDEKEIALERVYIDLSSKPDWFLAISPTGKTPLLRVGDVALFESAAICEYLDETSAGSLMSSDPLKRALTRAWMEFASGVLSEIAGLYTAPTAEAYEAKRRALRIRFERLDEGIVGPWFEGRAFGHVDAAFGPVFRYLDAFERLLDLRLAQDLSAVEAWRRALAGRPSVAAAVAPDYQQQLTAFLAARGSHLSRLIAGSPRVSDLD